MRRSVAALFGGLMAIGVGAALGVGCGGDDEAPRGDGPADATADTGNFDFGDACASGSACGDGGVCAGNVCCDPKLACGDACCGGGQVCSFQKCVALGGPCVDSSDCKPSEVCDYSLGSPDAGAIEAGCQGGAIPKTGRCLPRPPVCAPDAGSDGGAANCIERCEFRGSGAFKPVLKYAWGGQITAPTATDVMMAPIVIQLDDDNCDGKVNENDIPEIVFSTFTAGAYTKDGTLHAISVKNGAFVEKWAKAGQVTPSGQLAGGDVDGLPGNEVVACVNGGGVRAYRGDGSVLWTTPASVGCYMPNIADLDGDGLPEVVVEGGILNGATGAIKAPYSPVGPVGGLSVSDLDGDGRLDIVTASQAFHADGVRFVDTGAPASFNAIGDFDRDGKPEVVAVNHGTHAASFWRYDATAASKFVWVRQNVDINGKLAQHCPSGSAGFTGGGGPPTVADFNGDGVPDVALAGGIGYTILDGAKVVNPAITNPNTVLWTVATTDCSSAATGSSVFDFDGDGKAEVIYSDENYLRIYDGPTGAEKFKVCNTTGTLIEYPLVADVDNDGHADIIVVSNAYASGNAAYQCNDGKAIAQSGVRVFGDTNGSWVRTRRIWNQHAYHVTNVNEDGTIPKNELRNWLQPGLNNFRQNKQPGSEFAAPDAIARVFPACGADYGLYATVTNVGEAALPAGVVVGFYAGVPGAGAALGQMSTTQVLYPAQSETLFLPLPAAPAGVRSGQTPVYVVVDDTKTPHPSWAECRTGNNVATGTGACQGPK